VSQAVRDHALGSRVAGAILQFSQAIEQFFHQSLLLRRHAALPGVHILLLFGSSGGVPAGVTHAPRSALVQHSPLDRLVNCPHLDVVPRELISQLQARAQCIDEAPMPRFRPPSRFARESTRAVAIRSNRFSWHPPLACSTGVSQFGSKGFKRLRRNVFQSGSRRSRPAAWG
jgi:hypothetical protein